MAEMPPAAAAPVSVELLVVVDVTVAVELAEPEPAALVALPELPSAEERMERALAPVVAAVEAEERASGRVVSRSSTVDTRIDWILTLAVLGAERDHRAGLAGTASLVGAVAHTVAKVGLLAVAEDVVLPAAELSGRNAKHVVDAGALDRV
jgi:hypothetical protein